MDKVKKPKNSLYQGVVQEIHRLLAGISDSGRKRKWHLVQQHIADRPVGPALRRLSFEEPTRDPTACCGGPSRNPDVWSPPPDRDPDVWPPTTPVEHISVSQIKTLRSLQARKNGIAKQNARHQRTAKTEKRSDPKASKKNEKTRSMKKEVKKEDNKGKSDKGKEEFKEERKRFEGSLRDRDLI
jgi:katanin p60 ATPase-containing subunit A1